MILYVYRLYFNDTISKPSVDIIRAAVFAQLGYVRKDLEYIDRFMQQGYTPAAKFSVLFITIHLLYEQQKYMYD